MIEIPDYIYQRSVINQLYLKEESRHLFQKNAYSVSIIREKPEAGYYAEAAAFKTCREAPVLRESDFNGILRKLFCAGGILTEINAEIIFAGGFEEAELRQFSASLKRVSDKLKAQINRVSVYLENSSEARKNVILSGRGPLKSSGNAPWQRQKIFEGQDIILTGSLGRAGMSMLFHRHQKELEGIYPEIYTDRMKRRIPDRLPLAEMENAPFYGTTAMLGLEEGGLTAGLWNLGDRKDAGLTVYADRLKYDQETIELTNHFNLNPLELNSSGAYLISSDRGEELVYALRNAGLDAVCIGKVTEDKKRVIIFEDEERFIESPRY